MSDSAWVPIPSRAAGVESNEESHCHRILKAHFLRVAAAFLPEREREAAERLAAALRAWRDSAVLDAALWPSRTSLRLDARERLADTFPFPVLRPLRVSRAACSRVSSDAFFGGGSLTPARRALDSPMAMTCFAERAPCLPSRTCSISSRTNSPACVLADFPSRLSFSARSSVSFSGRISPFAFREPREESDSKSNDAFHPDLK